MSIKTTLNARGLRPHKKWGQHFLTDERILAGIADAADVTRDDTILEIGPGLGHLTRVLAQRAARVVAVEVDADLVTKLRADFADTTNVAIVRGDVLDAEPHEWITTGVGAGSPRPYKIVANLPYYITSAILRHVLQATLKPRVIVVMVQREVAQRIVAQPPQMNLLAVSVQFFAQPRIVRTIPAGAFYPRPKVDSAIVRLDVFERTPFTIESDRFFEIARAGFGERRKQLRNALAHGLGRDTSSIEDTLTRARIDPTRRAETLTLNEWANLCHAFTEF
ncbi:MAG: 16S rRNA (adenine(1518)-N(6)/adenine(1519)-N(6))-dimethyltransferase RsmA [Anaerolineales bacterium]|nr:16S rRNA (adenine(1518)-N(6)/adenine(1519)-N(6))-dimethyltransferase RsmA [Anaerolineales bacterium]